MVAGSQVALGSVASSGLPSVLPSAAKFPNLHAMLANVRNGVSDGKLCQIGDSDGSGFATAANALVGQGSAQAIRSFLIAAGIPAAVGLAIPTNSASPSTDPRLTFGSGWSIGPATLPGVGGSWGGLNTGWAAAAGASGTLVFTPNSGDTYDSYDIYFLNSGGALLGTTTATVPGGGTAICNGNGGTSIISKVTTSAGTAAANQTLTFGAPAGGAIQGAVILGVEPFLSTSKRVRVANACVNSASTTNWTSAPGQAGWQPLSAIQAYAANVWLLELGGDDAVQGLAGSVSFANYTAIAAAMRNTAADILGLTITPINPALATPAAVTAAMATLKSWCNTNGAGFIDVLTAWGGPNGAVSVPGITYYADGLGHPSVLGLTDLGRIITAALLTN